VTRRILAKTSLGAAEGVPTRVQKEGSSRGGRFAQDSKKRGPKADTRKGKIKLQNVSPPGIFSCLESGRSVAWLARLFRVQEVVSSNLTAPTIQIILKTLTAMSKAESAKLRAPGARLNIA
jgi:hypothetical protein